MHQRTLNPLSPIPKARSQKLFDRLEANPVAKRIKTPALVIVAGGRVYEPATASRSQGPRIIGGKYCPRDRVKLTAATDEHLAVLGFTSGVVKCRDFVSRVIALVGAVELRDDERAGFTG